MKTVAKYNIFKGISTLATVGTPIITLFCCSNMFVHRPETAISAAGLFTIFVVMLLLKDRIAEQWKVPSAFVVSTACLILVIIAEHIILPVKTVCLATMLTSGVDELTFKRFYKVIEIDLPENYKKYNFAGFIMTTSEKLLGENKDVNGTESDKPDGNRESTN